MRKLFLIRIISRSMIFCLKIRRKILSFGNVSFAPGLPVKRETLNLGFLFTILSRKIMEIALSQAIMLTLMRVWFRPFVYYVL